MLCVAASTLLCFYSTYLIDFFLFFLKELAKYGGIFGNQARNFFRQAQRALVNMYIYILKKVSGNDV